MKSNTKTALVFLAILAAVFLIALLDGSGAVQSAVDGGEKGTLIGAFVSEEDLDIGGDIEVTATGRLQWREGRLYAEELQKSWHIPDLPDGGGIYCAMRTETEGELAGEKAPVVVNVGDLGRAKSKLNVSDADGVRTVDVSLSGEVYACGGDTVFHCYPIYQLPDGRVYLTHGSSFGTSGDRDGESTTFTLTSDKSVTTGDKSERTKVKVAITAVVRPTPTKFTVSHMDENDNLLKLEEFAPGALPKSVTPVDGAAYLIGTSYGAGRDGETAEYDICSRGEAQLATFAYRDGRLTAAAVSVNWKEGAA